MLCHEVGTTCTGANSYFSISPLSRDEGENGDRSLGPPGKPLYTWWAAHSRWHPPQESRTSTRRARGARPFRLSTDLPGPNDASEEEKLVDALSKEELFKECLEEELNEPILEEALELVEATSASGYGDLPRMRHLHLRAKNAKDGGILAAEPQRNARLKKGHDIGNLFGFPILILSGNADHQ
ncbi:hypothetical protein Cgig2_005899 [Carnegiea gigantea]|uniref:Uncharacterized protein n=1 Tax=Carnegiea gigantea TaxID=171969 RepID=A0A9Q1Q4N7_9CARY|nr:hypothetical protein Cgig2_005899 [Carnegiea gigantea]